MASEFSANLARSEFECDHIRTDRSVGKLSLLIDDLPQAEHDFRAAAELYRQGGQRLATANHKNSALRGWSLAAAIAETTRRLDDDEGERNDLATDQPQKTRELLETLNQWVEETRRN